MARRSVARRCAFAGVETVDEQFPRLEIEGKGYNVETHGQKSYNGVAILSKRPMEDVERGLPGDPEDDQALLKPQSMVFGSPRSTCPTAIRHRAISSTINLPGWTALSIMSETALPKKPRVTAIIIFARPTTTASTQSVGRTTRSAGQSRSRFRSLLNLNDGSLANPSHGNWRL